MQSKTRWSALLIILLLGLSIAACNVTDEQDTEVNENDPQQNQQNADNDNQDNQDNQNQNQNDQNQNDGEEDLQHAEVHQWCAAAGEASDGSVTTFNCAGPHDVSGFEATNGETTWQPGAFRVAAE